LIGRIVGVRGKEATEFTSSFLWREEQKLKKITHAKNFLSPLELKGRGDNTSWAKRQNRLSEHTEGI